MKYITVNYDEEGRISLLEDDLSALAPDEVRVKGLVCGICSWDIATCKYGREMTLPAPPGHEGVVEVIAVGEKVRGIEPGEKYALGGFQTFANLPAERFAGKRIPEGPKPDTHWLVEPVSCCVTALDTSPLRAGDYAAVVGCGFMGQIILQILARSYAVRVVGYDISEDRLALARALPGVETRLIPPDWKTEWKEELARSPFDVIYDTTGAEAGLDLATCLVRRGGHINLFGWMKGTRAHFDPSAWHLKGVQVYNSSPAGQLRNTFPAAIRLLESGRVDLGPLVSHVVPLPEYPALMQSILAGDSSYVKGVVLLS